MFINDKLVLNFLSSLVLSHLLLTTLVVVLALTVLVLQAARRGIRVWLLGCSEHHGYWTRLERLGGAIANIWVLDVLLTWKHRSEMHCLLATRSIFGFGAKVLMRLLTVGGATAVKVNCCRESLYISVLNIASLMEKCVSTASLVLWHWIGSNMGWNTEWQHIIGWHLRLVAIIRITK